MSMRTGVDELEKLFYAYAYTAFAGLVRDVYKNGFRAFVAILPCETGALQASARFVAKTPSAEGTTIATGHGTASPVFGWIAPPKGRTRPGTAPMPVRVSAQTIPNPANVRVRVLMPSTESMAEMFMRTGRTSVTANMFAARDSYDEPEMAEYSQRHGYGNYSVDTLHIGSIVANFGKNFTAHYAQLSKTMPVDIAAVRKVAK